MRTPARSADADAACPASLRRCSASSATPSARALPEDAERRASRANATPSSVASGECACHAVCGSHPKASNSEARRSKVASPAGANAAVAPAEAGTVIPAGQTDILGSFTYRISFMDSGQQFGLAGAITLIIFLVVTVIAYANFVAMRRATSRGATP